MGLPPPQPVQGWLWGLGSLRTDSRRARELHRPLSLRGHSLPPSEKELFFAQLRAFGVLCIATGILEARVKGQLLEGAVRPLAWAPGLPLAPSTPGLAAEGGLCSTHSHEPTQPPPPALPGKGPGVSQRRLGARAVGVPLSSCLGHTDPQTRLLSRGQSPRGLSSEGPHPHVTAWQGSDGPVPPPRVWGRGPPSPSLTAHHADNHFVRIAGAAL